MKRCPRCKTNKHIKDFYPRQGYCKPCQKIIRKKYYEDHKEKAKKYIRHHKKMRTDVQYALKHRLRTRFSLAVRKDTKVGSAVRDLGCSILELKLYLEQKFHIGMTWENYGSVWHIDHIIPLAVFDLTDRRQVKKVCHWSNLQPLFAKDNLSKGGKYFGSVS